MLRRRPNDEQKLQRIVARARLVMAVERLTEALWPTPLLIASFLVLALSGAFASVPPWLHLVLLAAFAVGLAWLLGRAARRFAWPDIEAAERRVERVSDLGHRPFQVLVDRPISEQDAFSGALWRAHRRRAFSQLQGLRRSWPKSPLPQRDPRALRVLALLLLFVALIIAGRDAGPRLAQALTPSLTLTRDRELAYDIWIEPPDYTGLPMIFAQDEDHRISVPAGSVAVVRVNGSGSFSLAIGETKTVLRPVGEEAAEARADIPAGRTLSLLRGSRTIASWELEVVPDVPPMVELAEMPATTPQRALRIAYRAGDDHGLTALTGEIRQLDDDSDLDPVTLNLPFARGARDVESSVFNDLTAHPMAGTEVALTLFAQDAAGQTAASRTVSFVLPEREFTHPVAREVIAQRRRLRDDPQVRISVARELGRISSYPGRFDDDLTVFLALTSGKWRLLQDRNRDAIDSVRDVLWNTALRIEDGDMALSMENVRRAHERLLEALADDAPAEEIARRMAELRRAIAEHLQNMLANAERNPQQALPDESELMQAQDLDRMLRQIEELAQAGSREAAMNMLAQMQNMLESLQSGGAGQMQDQQQAEAAQRMQELQELMSRQQELMDQTFSGAMPQGGMPQDQQQPGQSQPGAPQPGQDGQPGMYDGQLQALSEAQDALRRALGDFMRRTGEATGKIPGGLSRAEQAMRQALQQLGEGQRGGASEAQGEALQQLQQAGRSMLEEMARQMSQQGSAGVGQAQPGRQPGQDPLGRPQGASGGLSQEGVDVPDAQRLQRAQEIRDELNRRSGERSRPEVELDYIRRLLERF